MASFPDDVKLDRLFKAGQNRARGDGSTPFYEEKIPTVVDVAAWEVYAESIPSTPPSVTTNVVRVWNSGGAGRISLTLDRKYNNNRVWVAKATQETNFSSGSGDLTNILKNFVSPKYGAGYIVKVYDGSGNPIPEADDASWLFDYKAGVLTFETNRPEGGTSTTDCIKIDVYQYVGLMVSDHIAGYTHVQSVPASVWTVVHNMRRFPAAIRVVDSFDEVVVGDIADVDNTTLTITFNGAFSGKAYVS